MNHTIRSLLLYDSISASPIFSVRSHKNLDILSSQFSRISSNVIFSSGKFPSITIEKSNFRNVIDTAIKLSQDNYTISQNSIRDQHNFLKLYHTAFVHCSTTNSNHEGGAIYSEVCPVEINNCLFICCFAKSSGGAIRAERASNSTITSCVFSNNTAEYLGGAICFSVIFELKLANTNFTYNRAIYYSGTVALMNCDAPSISECIDYDSRSQSGGAWYINNGESEFTLVTFIGMTVDAIHSLKFAICGIFTCNFQLSKVTSIHWNSIFQLTVSESVFDLPQDQAISIISRPTDKPTISNCHFGMSVELDLSRQIPQIPIEVPEKVRIELVKKDEKQYAESLVIIQNNQYNDAYEGNEGKSYSRLTYYLTCLCLMLLTVALNFKINRRPDEKKGVLGQLNNYTPGLIGENKAELYNKNLFPQIQTP
ncbi:polymorphic outer membrane protein, putative [Trichomonas vaginalis G3]|uniref:Polymorphic outer membrane protein, putative n=1 Tax=Trichomonas vaginalis (strain ATCC PRA-98 / G3) TaxID=412133 RepID=A2ETZ6_TRIV3|nr:pectin lyase-like family [Trichomonas vaginalis G3]EAY03884.1 polymorphic outer membrane protein, putative [Trichomonas vaginalis G3]KAI5552938.1 pectin lyase-like family [Trichomonas vaginalis G3]|eukprot:XP_001316107.1 polymorphic outer membrane protein [Trichomonas vaginalis G3]